MKIRRNYKKIIIGALILSAVFIVMPSVAQAGALEFIFGDSAINLISTATKVFGWMIQGIAALALTVVGYLLNLSLDINLSIVATDAEGDPVNAILKVGWQIVRDVANLGFVLAIIIIAFATILRFQEYGAKKLLTRLIVMALLVNFSFVIAAGFINVSNAFTNFFLQTRIGGVGSSFNLAGSITGAFNPQRLLVAEETGGAIPPPLVIEDEAGGFATISTALLVSVAGLFFSTAFLLILVITYGAMAIMFIIRYIALTFLIIISPVAWLLWAVPKMSGQFDKWWSEFLKWVFFAPIMSFFIYLALVAADQLQFENMKILGGGGILGFSDIIRNLVMQGSQMVVLAGILLGGLMVANSMSIHGARASLGVAKAGVKGLGRWTGYRAERAGRGVMGVGREMREKGLKEWGQDKVQGAKKWIKSPIKDKLKGGFRVAAKPFKEAGQAMRGEGLKKPTTVAGFVFEGMRKGSGVWQTKGEKSDYSLKSEDELRDVMKKRNIPVKPDDTKKYMVNALNEDDKKEHLREMKKRGGREGEEGAEDGSRIETGPSVGHGAKEGDTTSAR